MQKGKMVFQYNILIIFIVLIIIACGGGGNGDDGGNTGGTSITTGQWSGNAGFGEVEFEVTSNSPEALAEFAVIFSSYTCDITTYNLTVTLSWTNGLEIVNRQIDLVIDFGDPMDPDILTIDGVFEASGDYISGNFELDNGTICSGTWVAQPN